MDACRVVVADSEAVLAENCRVALTFWPRFMGLMMRRELPDGQGMLFPRCSSIHMFLMRFAIDAVYVDRSNRVVKIVENLKPWRISACGGASAVVEIPAGRAHACELQVGQALHMEHV